MRQRTCRIASLGLRPERRAGRVVHPTEMFCLQPAVWLRRTLDGWQRILPRYARNIVGQDGRRHLRQGRNGLGYREALIPIGEGTYGVQVAQVARLSHCRLTSFFREAAM